MVPSAIENDNLMKRSSEFEIPLILKSKHNDHLEEKNCDQISVSD